MHRLVRVLTLSIAVLFIFSCGKSCQIVHAPNWQNTALTAMESVVKVEIYEHDTTLTLRGIGSGFVITSDGYVITNAHVVVNTLRLKDPEIHLVFKDHRRFKVSSVVALTEYDLALLKVSAEYLTPIKLEPELPKIGAPVIAIGTPWPYEFSVMQGIVSHTHVRRADPEVFESIQHTAAINSGCSGGPLINVEGKVIGINHAGGINHGERLEGVGLAIPTATLIDFLKKLIEKELTDLEEIPS